MKRMQKQDSEATNRQRMVRGKFTAAAQGGAFANRINNSPAMVAQRQQLGSMFGDAIQRVEEEEPAQGEFETVPSVQRKEGEARPNNTGLPDNLKSGIESLSGMSMDSVRVHYNSSQPAQLNAHAYTQGTDIHVASGQERHLPHEAWHVVQQAQGRVQPTMQMKEGVPVNDDKSLEHEADVMGGKAASVGVMQGKLIEPVHIGSQLQMKKDPAVHDFGDGESGVTTSTKVIDPKDGSRGLFKYHYGSGYIIDTFNGTNIADAKTAKGSIYEGLGTPNISVAVKEHDLAADYGDGGLDKNEIETGKRSTHFEHADKAHKVDRTNKYTWHHLQKLGKMELIDMNVHGAMWHYGGIAGWKASLHTSDSSDDDPAV